MGMCIRVQVPAEARGVSSMCYRAAPRRRWDPNSDLLEEHQVPLSAEPSLRPAPPMKKKEDGEREEDSTGPGITAHPQVPHFSSFGEI